jgi:dUTP pyrophosphatase
MNHPPAAATSTASIPSAPGVPAPYVGLVDVALQRLDADLPLPAYAHPGDAGADLVTRVDVELPPGGRATVPTGVAIALPEGYAGFVHPRSGLAARCGVTTLNAPGTIDAGYRGEIQVTLLNTDLRQPVVLRRGERIAQLVVQRVEHAVFVPVAELPGSVRGAGGHGSTGGFAGHDARPGTNVGADAPEGETS